MRASSLRAWWNRAFALLLALSLTAGCVSVVLVTHLVHEYRATASEEDRETQALSSLSAAVAIEMDASHHAVDLGLVALQAWRNADNASRRQFTAARLAFDSRDQAALAAAKTTWDDAYARLRTLAVDRDRFDAYHAGLTADGLVVVHAELGASQQALMAFLARLDHQIHVESHQGLVTSKTIERDVLLVFLVFAALLVLLVVTLARRLQRRVIAPVHELAEASREFGEGNLDRRPAVDQDDEIGRLAHAFSSMADAIADQHDELRRKAFHDPLTGLTRQAAGVEQEGVLFIDLDDFKLVNDTRGHAAGDRLLQLVAERLVAAVRESDVVARIGGDEFAVLIAHPVERDTVLTIADRVLEELAVPFDLDGYLVSVGASIGVALRDVQAHDTDLLLRAADAVMYVAKGRGKNRVEVFDPVEHAHLLTGPVTPRR